MASESKTCYQRKAQISQSYRVDTIMIPQIQHQNVLKLLKTSGTCQSRSTAKENTPSRLVQMSKIEFKWEHLVKDILVLIRFVTQ